MWYNYCVNKNIKRGAYMRKVMESELEIKKKRLKKLQEYFEVYIKNINSPNYEDNAINSLLEMKKLKTEIQVIEYYLQMPEGD